MRSAWLSIAILPLAACASSGRQGQWENQPPTTPAGPTRTSTSAGASASNDEAEPHWSKRDEKAEVQKAIAAWEAAAAKDAANADVRVKLARAYYFYADAHLATEGASDEDQMAAYQKGVDWGEQALLIADPNFGKIMKEQDDFVAAMKQIGKPAVPAAYWYCTNLGRFAKLKGLRARLYYKDRVKAAMERMLEVDPTFFYAGPDRYLGAWNSLVSGMMGGDVEKSKLHFKNAREKAPAYLINHVTEAEFLAVRLDDKALYKKLLEEAIAAPAGDDPDNAPENRAAQKKAKKMLADIDKTF